MLNRDHHVALLYVNNVSYSVNTLLVLPFELFYVNDMFKDIHCRNM